MDFSQYLEAIRTLAQPPAILLHSPNANANGYKLSPSELELVFEFPIFHLSTCRLQLSEDTIETFMELLISKLRQGAEYTNWLSIDKSNVLFTENRLQRLDEAMSRPKLYK